jgi:hypothetical protein
MRKARRVPTTADGEGQQTQEVAELRRIDTEPGVQRGGGRWRARAAGEIAAVVPWESI